MKPYHEVQDQSKVEMLAASMEANGWQGAPLVKVGEDQLITGVHRYAAAHGLLEWTNNEIPTINLEDLFEMCGMDFEQVYTEEGCPQLSSVAFACVTNHLPAEVLEKYGIDLN